MNRVLLAVFWFALCTAVRAATPAPCQPARFDNGPAHFKMEAGARAEIQAFECSRASLLRQPAGQGAYLVYRVGWTEGGELTESLLGDVGDPHENVLELRAERVGGLALALIEKSERGGRLYLWQKEATPFVLDFMDDEESSLCFAAQKDGGIVISHCHGAWYGPRLRVRWLQDEGLWQAPGWKEIKAFNAAGGPGR